MREVVVVEEGEGTMARVAFTTGPSSDTCKRGSWWWEGMQVADTSAFPIRQQPSGQRVS